MHIVGSYREVGHFQNLLDLSCSSSIEGYSWRVRHHPLQKHQSITPQSLRISFSKSLRIPFSGHPPDPRPTSHIDNSHPHSDEAKAKQRTKIRSGLGPEARCPKLYVQATSEMKICEARVLRCLCDKAFVKTDNFSS